MQFLVDNQTAIHVRSRAYLGPLLYFNRYTHPRVQKLLGNSHDAFGRVLRSLVTPSYLLGVMARTVVPSSQSSADLVIHVDDDLQGDDSANVAPVVECLQQQQQNKRDMLVVITGARATQSTKLATALRRQFGLTNIVDLRDMDLGDYLTRLTLQALLISQARSILWLSKQKTPAMSIVSLASVAAAWNKNASSSLFVVTAAGQGVCEREYSAEPTSPLVASALSSLSWRPSCAPSNLPPARSRWLSRHL